MPPIETDSSHKQTKSTAGPVVGALIVVTLLMFGGLYFYGAHLNKEQSLSAPVAQADIEAS